LNVLEKKLRSLENLLSQHANLGIAFSGGVDSTFLLAFAAAHLQEGRSITAITVSAPNFAPDEVEFAKDFCENRGIRHMIIAMDFNSIEGLSENTEERCYFCKRSIFSTVKRIAGDNNIPVIADGTNLDDQGDYRPGKKALLELGVLSPLLEADLTKEEIRQAAFDMDLPVWNKPAYACLASRVPYGEPITEEKLGAIYLVEKEIRDLGFSQVRVRHHGDIARIELLTEDFTSFVSPEITEKIDRAAKIAGFRYAALDLSGYRMGNMNTHLERIGDHE
jgi:uncharacterized protein